MADAKISQLPVATTPLAGTELMEIVQGGVNKQVATSEVGGGGAVDSVNGQTGVVQVNADDVPFTPAGSIAATDVQAALEELDSEKYTASAATESAQGLAELATQGETNTGTDDARIVTPLKMATYVAAAVAASSNVVDQVSTSTAGGTITLDMNNQVQRSHVGSASFNSAKAIAMSNTTNSLFFNFLFEVTSVSAVITFPSDWICSSFDFNGTTWTPPETGRFEFGGSHDAINNLWYIKVSGDFV